MASEDSRWLPRGNEISLLIALWALVMGAYVRIWPAVNGTFPVNDGGLFYSMEQDLIQNRFALPEFASFNQESIPFAYPPLGLYVTAFLSVGFGVPLLELHRFLPPLLGIAALPLVYLLAHSILRSRWKAALAMLAYAMIPQTNQWLTMGGGVTRGWGCLFSLVSMIALWRLITKPSVPRTVVLALAFLGLFLSHPEWTLDTAIWVVLAVLLVIRNWKTLLGLCAATGVAVVLASPWWLTILLRHGANPFFSAMQTGGSGALQYLAPLFILTITGEEFLTVIMLTALLGVLVAGKRKEWFLPVWVVIPFFIAFRNASLFVAIPIAMLSSIGFSDFLVPAVMRIGRKSHEPEDPWQSGLSEAGWTEAFLANGALKVLLVFYFGYSLINAFHNSQLLAQIRISKEETDGFAWVKANTPADSRFMIMEKGDYFISPLAEWFPALAERENLLLLQGYEWTDGHRYLMRMAKISAAQDCIWGTVECVESWAAQNDQVYDYIWVYRGAFEYTSGVETRYGGELIGSLRQSPDYQLVYQSPKNWIFRHVQ